MYDTKLIQDYCRVVGALRPMIEPVGRHEERVKEILPIYQSLLNELSRMGMKGVIVYLQNVHNRALSELNLNYYCGTDVEIQFKSIIIPELQQESSDVNNPLSRFASMSKVLTGKSLKKMEALLPEYEGFMKELHGKNSVLLGEFIYSQASAVKKAYGKSWPVFVGMSVIGANSKGSPIAYADTRGHTFKESIDWVLSEDLKRPDAMSLTAPAKLYARWLDMKDAGEKGPDGKIIDQPTRTFASVEEIITDPDDFSGCSHLVCEVAIKGLPLNNTQPVTVPIVISNSFGRNDRLLISRTPHYPHY